MHGGTQTIRFWGLQHVHWCEGSCCWFLRLQSRLVWDVPRLSIDRGCAAHGFRWLSRPDWFVPIHTSSHSRKQSAFGGYNMSTGVKAHVAGSCGCKAGWFEMFPRLCKVDRGCAAAWQVGFSIIYWHPGRRLVCSRASSIGLRCRFCEVHRRHLMHGGTQTIRFWGLQHVHWCEGSCCWVHHRHLAFGLATCHTGGRLMLACSQGCKAAKQVGLEMFPRLCKVRQGMCGSLAGWFQVAIVQKGWENWCNAISKKGKNRKHLRSWFLQIHLISKKHN